MPYEAKTLGNVRAGVPHIIDQTERASFYDAFKTWPDCEVEFTIKRIGSTRSTPQHRYYFGVVVPIIRDCINDAQGETFDKAEVHEWLKKEFNSHEVETENGHSITIARSTRKLDTAEFTSYIERCRQWCASFFDVNIPDPVKIQTAKTQLQA